MKKIFLTLTLCSLFSGAVKSQSITRLVTVSNGDNLIRILDTNNYSTVGTIPMAFTSSSLSLTGATGLAKHPSSGAYYIIAKNTTGRYLGILNPNTGSVSAIGDMGDAFAGITFNSNNSLFGVTGYGANVPNTAYRVNPLTASSTSITPMINGSYGESICFNPVSNKVYHWTGSPTVYEKFDTTFASLTNIPTLFTDEIAGSVYKSSNKFITTTYFGDINEIDTVGNATLITSYSVNIKGMAYITCPRSITGVPTVCGGAPATLTMSANGTSYQWYLNGIAIANATTQAISTTTLGYYKCMISDGCGTDSIAAGVNVGTGNLPVVSITGNTLICSGQTTTLTGSAGGTSQWYKNGIVIPAATSNTYAAGTQGIYNMTKTNTNGCKDSANVGKTVSVTPSPTINVSSTATLICAGQQATLSATGAGTYSWNTGSSTSSIVISPTVTSTYTVTGTANNCSATYTTSQAVSPCTSLSNSFISEVKIYPNPSSSVIYIENNNEFMSYEIIDVTGKIITSNSLGTSTVIDVSNFNNGIFVIKLVTKNGEAAYNRIVIAK